MKKRFFITLFLSILILASCSNGNSNNDGATNNPQEDDIKDLVASYSGDKSSKQEASITGTQLIVTEENGTETTYPLPEDEFFVSIAPFKDETHPCTNHSLTGCQGELTSETFEVYVEDSEGNVVYQNLMSTGENGFIDLWLPRNDTFSVSITQENEQAETEISTYDDSPTCITTMQLG